MNKTIRKDCIRIFSINFLSGVRHLTNSNVTQQQQQQAEVVRTHQIRPSIRVAPKIFVYLLKNEKINIFVEECQQQIATTTNRRL